MVIYKRAMMETMMSLGRNERNNQVRHGERKYEAIIEGDLMHEGVALV